MKNDSRVRMDLRKAGLVAGILAKGWLCLVSYETGCGNWGTGESEG